MSVLSSGLRKQLESGVLAARRAAELGARSAIENLGVFSDRKPDHVTGDAAVLRNGLRAKWRQLGLENELLVAECAFEQWHRLLFARFLAENGLLLHPELNIPVTLDECGELAEDLSEPDGWSVAARFASQILPGIFRVEDPCVRIRLAPEHRIALEEILAGLPVEVFTADDSLGWVYQYWQKDSKDEVNASERKVGGADLGPVTQLFTENYMVRFLLENSLGAWWAARHPKSPLLKSWEYLRFNEDGTPAAGAFDGWPARVAEVTVMDPCCGSGHFLVDAFGMLWRMRAEEEGLSPVDAQDAVLRDNLFGLELDARCVQIAMFAVAFQAWKDGRGWRQLPMPNIACSGIPVKTPLKEWAALAEGDERLEAALTKLHVLFRDADTLGSLIDPRRAIEGSKQQSFDDVEWREVLPLIKQALSKEISEPSAAVLGADASSIARTADFLARRYSLVSTNPPFLGLERMNDTLRLFVRSNFPTARRELALAILERSWELSEVRATMAFVLPSEWTFVRAGRSFREDALTRYGFRVIAWLGDNSFTTTLRVSPLLVIVNSSMSRDDVAVLDATEPAREGKPHVLKTVQIAHHQQAAWRDSQDFRITLETEQSAGIASIGDVADARNGASAGDSARFERFFWEIPCVDSDYWELLQTSPESSGDFGGMEKVVLWEREMGSMARLADSVQHLNHAAQNWRRGKPLWGRSGVVVSQIGAKTGRYLGDRFDSTCFAIVPNDTELTPPLVAYAQSGELQVALGKINPTWKLGSPKTLLQLPFDVDRWRAVAAERFPDGLPEPWSDDPTQWLFEGRPEVSTSPLQVAVGRLLGFRWPEQSEQDDLDGLADTDGIVCLPSVAGEAPASEQLADLLAAAYGASWNAGTLGKLLVDAASKKKTLTDWLRDEFFKQHCALFGHRPFVWHVWDGHPQGFSALVNYHRLDRKTFEKLTYTYLGTDWIERQRAAVRDNEPGAEARLAAAEGLKKKLELILQGEAPYDIYVRWKPLEEQPLGWDPDLNDGVRLNIRPFVEAGVLRSTLNIHWKKDRGTNPDGTERLNDIHLTLAKKQNAKKQNARKKTR